IKDLDIVIKELITNQHLPSAVWQRLGLQLGLYYEPRLVDIDEKHRGDPVKCFYECMSAWLKGEDKVREKGDPSWSSLATALDAIEEKSIASYIRDKYPHS
uniref:Death domain-containing protein n=1 Tax=Amphimedon queenslandica TaxID=400682 RepID=A0A1X7SVY1_AMPQE